MATTVLTILIRLFYRIHRSRFSSESLDPIIGTVWTHQRRDWWIEWDLLYQFNTSARPLGEDELREEWQLHRKETDHVEACRACCTKWTGKIAPTPSARSSSTMGPLLSVPVARSRF